MFVGDVRCFNGLGEKLLEVPLAEMCTETAFVR